MYVYLGYRVNKDGICSLPEKVDFIKNNSSPQNVCELKWFLGLINYYDRHLPRFATVLEPLHDLLNESNLVIHYNPQKTAFSNMWRSPYSIGAVLSHLMPDRSQKPIMLASRTLSKAE